jgi:DNA-binding PadR family transcriptional regulator
MECRILSELAILPFGGVSCRQLARAARLSEGTLYVLLGRLANSKRVLRQRAPLIRCGGQQVLYTITAKGLKARERFARDVGLVA